ncbi:hypothetical protein BsWGS_21472 [Bradybaena similaris]
MNPAVLAVVLLAVLGHQANAHDPHELRQLGEAASDFAQKLQQQLARDNKESLVLSPISIHSGLSMISLGARNETAEEMERILNLSPIPPSEAHVQYREILTKLQSTQDVKVEITNAMLVRSDTPIEREFKNEAESKYLARIESINVNQPEPEKQINEYISQKTEGEIRELIKKGSIDARTSVVVVSTISFNASFDKRFDESKTSKEEFRCENGKTAEVEMMNDTRSALLKRDEETDSDVLSMPFKNGRQSLVIVLPRKVGDLEKLEKQLSQPGKISKLVQGLKQTTVQIALPKFRIESRFQLKEKLGQMDMQRAFNPSSADFSGISQSERLYISEVHHAAVIDVDENGTRAAAATLEEIESKSHRETHEGPEEKFCADHGYMFVIYDNNNHQVIFQGKYTGPKESK